MEQLKRRYTQPAASSKASAWECLLFTLLSARTRDEQTEVVFQDLMRKWPTAQALGRAQVREVEQVLRKIGLYKGKARNVVSLAKMVQTKFGGKVPESLADLITLPGVGVKTARCVMVYAYGELVIPVDTHVQRIVNRLGWVKENTPEKTCFALEKTVPKKYWKDINRVMVQFGREVCVPGRPKCAICPVRQWCAYPRKST